MNKLESSVERTFKREAAKSGFLAIKLVALSRAGFPDRTCIGKNEHIFFVELKRNENRKPEKRQIYWHKLLRQLGFRVYVAGSKEQIEEIFREERKVASAQVSNT